MKKRIRWAEFLIEKGIATISFASLGAIVLIFLFVFREAAPILTMDGKTLATGHGEVTSSSHGGDDASGAVGAADTYGDPEPVGQAESYGDPDPAPIGAAESYGDPEPSLGSTAGDSTNSVAMESAPPPVHEETIAEPVEDPGSVLSQLLSGDWQPVGDHPKFGILPLVAGSFKVALVAILLGAPIGILSALFTSTFAPGWAKEIMKPVIEIMAGFPSVVIGFLALTILASLLQGIFGFDYRLNAFVGGVAMSLAVIPLIYTLSEESLNAIPKHFTEGSLALGATLWETNIRVVLPAAIPGIFAAVLLGVGRAVGETMIVLMATGNAALLSPDLAEPVRTVSASIGAEMAEVVFGDPHYVMLFVLGTILFVFSFALNAIAEIFIRQRLSAKFGGSQ